MPVESYTNSLSIPTHLGKVVELAPLQASEQQESNLLSLIIILIIMNSKKFTMVYLL